jgi:hypothetical protein
MPRELVVEGLYVGVDHDVHERRAVRLRRPAEVALRLARVADERVDLGGSLVAGVVGDVPLQVEPTRAKAAWENSRAVMACPMAST